MRYLLHDVFLDTVHARPESTAMVLEDGSSFTYADLNKLSNQFAQFILQHKQSGVMTDPYVGILSPVHERSVAAIIGTLKTGCAYVPLDEASPVERLSQILDNTKLDLIIIDEHLCDKFLTLFDHEHVRKVLVLGRSTRKQGVPTKITEYDALLSCSDKEPTQRNQVSDDLAYILHSSGTTGIPKGIMLTHRNARTFVDWMHKEFALTTDDVVMSRAPFKFDLSVFDIFNTFKAGATLVCFDWNKAREGDAKHVDYVNLLSRVKASILYTTPSTLIVLMNRGNLHSQDIRLRTIMYAGEPFPIPQLQKLMGVLPRTRVANIYGPTETNIITYYWVDTIVPGQTEIPLGNVVDDTEILAVSEDGTHVCEIDEVGELWCRGGTVTLGYLGMEDLTHKHQIMSPFHKYPAVFWRTGDFGYRDKDDLLHYRGRKDHMVKVKGFRIEIGEVESAVAQMPNIDEFAVVAKPDEKYGNRLYCFFSTLSGAPIERDVFASFLSSKIPDYMIPFKFTQIPSLPKTSSGKVDRILLANSEE